MKPSIAWTLPFWMVAAAWLAGCERSTELPTRDGPAPSAQASQEPEGTTLLVGLPAGLEEPLQTALSQFQAAHPSIKVRMETMPLDRLRESQLQALRDQPASVDVLLIDFNGLATLASAGLLLDLNPAWPEQARVDYFPGAVQATEYLGHAYALPWALEAGAIFYRSDVLQRHGASPPDSWLELMRVATEIQRKEPNLYGFVWPVTPSEDMVCAMLEFLRGNGGELFEQDQVAINRPENGYALSFAANLITRYKITPPPSASVRDPLQWFREGQALFIRSWTSAWPVLTQAFPGRVGVLPIPNYPDKTSAPILRGWQLAVASQSEDPQAAVSLAKFLSSPSAQKALAQATSITPALKRLYTDADLITQRPELPLFLPSLTLARPGPGSANYPRISRELQEAFGELLRGESTAEQVLVKLQKNLTDLPRPKILL